MASWFDVASLFDMVSWFDVAAWFGVALGFDIKLRGVDNLRQPGVGSPVLMMPALAKRSPAMIIG